MRALTIKNLDFFVLKLWFVQRIHVDRFFLGSVTYVSGKESGGQMKRDGELEWSFRCLKHKAGNVDRWMITLGNGVKLRKEYGHKGR